VLLQLAFYATPIIYPMSKITNVAAQKILFMNPMAQTIQDIRYVLVSDQVTTAGKILDGSPLLYVPYLLTLVFLVFGVYYFKKQAPNFAENL
jgi:ABC-2 type transport system permease protein